MKINSKEYVQPEARFWQQESITLYSKQAEGRIQEYARLQKARHLLDAISLGNELLTDGADVEVLSLISTIVKRLKMLGALNISVTRKTDVYDDKRTSAFKHKGIYHCCTFCSSGGRKEAVCGCRGTMPGGYQGCGHGHIGHPGVHHWSCCGSVLRHGQCLALQKNMYQVLF